VAKARTARKQKTSNKSRKSSAKNKSHRGKKTSAKKRAISRKSSGKSKKRPVKKTAKKKLTKKKFKKKTAKKVLKKKQAKKKAVEKAKKIAKTKASSTKTAPPKPEKAPSPVTETKTTPPPQEAPPSIEEALAMLPYGEGSFVVHPKYGLGKVDRIIERTLSTRTVPCMEISFPYQDMKLTMPVDQVGRSGLRPPIGRKEIENVFKVLRGRATFNAKRRSAKRVIDYRKRLSMGDPTSLAEAIRDLARLSLKKSLSYEERKILGTALRILSREVALTRGREPDDVREEIEKIVYR
jgi:CarD family transcriptional regulator